MALQYEGLALKLSVHSGARERCSEHLISTTSSADRSSAGWRDLSSFLSDPAATDSALCDYDCESFLFASGGMGVFDLS